MNRSTFLLHHVQSRVLNSHVRAVSTRFRATISTSSTHISRSIAKLYVWSALEERIPVGPRVAVTTSQGLKRRRLDGCPEPSSRESSRGLNKMGIFQSKAKKIDHDAPLAGDGEDVWLVVGLGNPGRKYEDNRHNVGFMTIDLLAREYGVDVNRLQKNSQVGRGNVCGHKVLLAKPLTFMNNSGEAVQKLAQFYKVGRSLLMDDIIHSFNYVYK